MTTMNRSSSREEDESAIRTRIDERVRAVRRKDVDKLMAHYAPDVATFDLVAPLTNQGVAAVRKRVVEWFSSFETSIDYELRDVKLSVQGDVAFDHHLTHVRGTNRAGEKVAMWFRETIGYRKTNGEWKIIHQHSSVPFDMEKGKPLMDLVPEP